MPPVTHIVQTSKSSSSTLKKQVWCASSWNRWQHGRKIDFLSVLALFGVKKDPKNMACGTHILFASIRSSGELTKQISGEFNVDIFAN